MPSRTNLRLSEQIRQRASHVILYELKDPRMGIVTITRVKLASDLSTVVIFWSVLGEAAQRSKTTHALDHARLFVQHRIAEGLHTRNAPQVSFEYDEGVEGALRMGGLLKSLREERGDAPPEAAAAADPGQEGPADEDAGEDAKDPPPA